MNHNLRNYLLKPVEDETSNSTSLHKWQVALLIGSPILIGAVAYYFYLKKAKKKVVNGTINSNTALKDKKPEVTAEYNEKKNEEKKIDDKHLYGQKIEDIFSDPISLKNQGNKYFNAKKYESAIECYSKAIQCSSLLVSDTLATFYQNRAASYEMIGKYQEVIDDCTKAFQLNKKYIKALQRRAKAYESLNKLNEALIDITAVNILEKFQNKSSLLMTDRLLAQVSKLKGKKYINSRTPSLPSKHFLKEYFKLFNSDPIVNSSDVSEHTLLALEKELKLKAQESLEIIDKARYLLLKSTLDMLKGLLENAEKGFLKVIEMDVNTDIKVNALIKIAIMKMGINDINAASIDTALKYFDQAIDLDPNNPDIYIHRAQVNLFTESMYNVLKDLNKCSELIPDFPNPIVQKVFINFQMALNINDQPQIKATLEQFKQVIKRFPNCSEAHAFYAKALMDKQEYEESDKSYAKALLCDPEDASLYIKRALIWINSDQEKGIKLIKKAIATDDKCQTAYELLGHIEIQRGNFKNGIEYLDNAIKWSNDENDVLRLFNIRESAEAQYYATKLLDIIVVPTGSSL